MEGNPPGRLDPYVGFAGSPLLARISSQRLRVAVVVLLADVLPTGLLGMVILVGAPNAAREEGPPALALDARAYVLLVLAVAAVPLRRHVPLMFLAAESMIVAGFTGLGYPHGPMALAAGVAAFTVGLRYRPRTTSRAAASAALIIVAGMFVSWARGYLHGGWGLGFKMLAVLAVTFVPAYVGALLRLNRISSARADEEATRRRVEQERLRMAREVHDVVGHGLSIISLQAAVALHVLDRRPEQAQMALDAIRRTSVEALNELRATLALTRAGEAAALVTGDVPVTGDPKAAGGALPGGALPGDGSSGDGSSASGTVDPSAATSAVRSAGPDGVASTPGSGRTAAGQRVPAERAPLTGLSRLPGLIREVRLCGVQVGLDVGDDLPVLPADVDLAAYRLIQESLTNVLRHAGHARARVMLRRSAGGLTIEVVDELAAEPADVPAGRAPESVVPAAGHGLAGLRERVAELGGSFDAGPRPGGGWRVYAELPLPAATNRDGRPHSTLGSRAAEVPA